MGASGPSETLNAQAAFPELLEMQGLHGGSGKLEYELTYEGNDLGDHTHEFAAKRCRVVAKCGLVIPAHVRRMLAV